jgi:Autographiviridae endonuclease VII
MVRTVPCRVCKHSKLPSEFWRDTRSKTGCQSVCKVCARKYIQENKAHRNRYCRTWYSLNKERVRGYRLKNVYRITQVEIDSIIKIQGGKCPICLKIFSSSTIAVVAHDHFNGKVRGMLCNSCNHGIGLLHDNRQYLQRAIQYLQAKRMVNS